MLIWNISFIVQDLVLFSTLQRASNAESATGAVLLDPPRAPWGLQLLMLAAITLPFLARTAWFDLWPSWGLYASSAERVTLLVHRRDLDQVPDAIRPFVDVPVDPNDPWLSVRLDRWALESLGAPIYPQGRFQLGAAEAAIVRYAPGQRARVIRFGLANRFSGEREHEVFTSLSQLQTAGDEYYFNTRPRRQGFQSTSD